MTPTTDTRLVELKELIRIKQILSTEAATLTNEEIAFVKSQLLNDYPLAHYVYAYMLIMGIGIAKNNDEAKAHLEWTFEHGDHVILNDLSNLYLILGDSKRSEECLIKAEKEAKENAF